MVFYVSSSAMYSDSFTLTDFTFSYEKDNDKLGILSPQRAVAVVSKKKKQTIDRKYVTP